MLQQSCEEFLEALASGSPVPGGGGSSAFCGALGAALGNMVCCLTSGKKKYADVQGDIERVSAEAQSLRYQLQKLVQEDAVAFEPLSKAYGLPKSTPEELEHRNAVMEKCLNDACAVPLTIMERCTDAIKLLQELAVKGSKIALSDVGVGVSFCRSGLLGASMNVYINTGLMKDRENAASLEKRADLLLEEWLPAADQVVKTVMQGIRR